LILMIDFDLQVIGSHFHQWCLYNSMVMLP
jgi:hypothetical protein